ncbi:hypothetical protein LF1_58690 [Rubripirellula obstinata]|uniref:Uncharacterized protein n=1 Tax=Rubripirellula obstinata TaxID=406547 RepID=A0A5B1C6Y9_9BACT|nr:hypothetical protein LF1_58690 [Rubripirellula obstinata]
MVTHGDGVRADEPHRNGVSRITIACTGVAAAHFSLCLHVKSRHLGDAYRYPTEPRTFTARSRPAGHNQRTTKPAFPPTLDQYLKCRLPTAGHQTDA